MRNLKKFLAVVVAIAVMMTAMVPAFAADAAEISADAQVVKTIKVLTGGNDGVTPEYLAKSTERIQAAYILLKLVGKYEEATKFDATDKATFADANLVGFAEGKNVLAYLKAHPEYGFTGYVSGKFGVTDTILPQQLYKVLLQALGFVQGTDYEYAEILDFAADKGLTKLADLNKLTNDGVATGIVEALKATEKGGKTLVEKLIADKVIAQEDAVTAGLVKVESATSATVKPTGAKKLTVEFNGTVDESKAVFTVKKGSITINVATKTFAADKKSVVLELASKITAGDYTVSVTGVATDAITAKATAEDEKVGKITFPSDKASLVRGDASKVNVSYKIFNQYEEDITETYNNITINPGRGSEGHNKGTITLTDSASNFVIDNKFVVSILDNGNNVFQSQTFTVVAEAKVAEIAIEKIVNVSDSAKVITAGETDTNYALVLDLKDQYGNSVTDLTYLNNGADISSNISDTSLAQFAATKYAKKTVDGSEKVVLQLAPPASGAFKSGKAVVTLVSTSTGKLATFTVEIAEVRKVDTITLEVPAYAAAGKDFDVPFTAVDQFGNEIKDADVLNGAGVYTGSFSSKSIASSQDTGDSFPTTKKVAMTFKQDYVNKKAILSVDNHMTAKGTITITFLTATYKQVTLKIDVTDGTVANVISGTKDFTPNVVKDSSTTLDFAEIIVKDQYGQDYTLDSSNLIGAAGLSVATDGKYRVLVSSSDEAKVAVTGTNPTVDAGVYQYTATTDTATLTGKAKGNATITVKLQKVALVNSNYVWQDVADGSYTFTSKVVEIADIASYEVAAFNKVYKQDNTRGTDVTVNGILADASKVVVDNTHYTVVSTDSNVTYNTPVAGKLVAGNVAIDTTNGNNKTDVTIIITVEAANGEQKIFTPVLTVSNEAPVATTLSYADSVSGTFAKEADGIISVSAATIGDGAGLATTVLPAAVKTVDQYGVELTSGTTPAEPAFILVASNYAAKDGSTVTINGSGTTAISFFTTPAAPAIPALRNVAAGDTFNVTAITNGKTLTFKVIVTD